MEQSPLSAAVATAKPGSGATRYAPALKVAGSILAESTLPRREVVLISDFQRSGWRGEEGIAPAAGHGADAGGRHRVATIRSNVSVTGVSLARSTFSDQERVAVTAGLTNRSAAPRRAASMLTLEVNGIKHGVEAGAARAGRLSEG